MSADGGTPDPAISGGGTNEATRRAAVRAAVAERRARVGGWVHERTGHRGAFDWLKGRTVPGGARWAYVTGPVCLGLFAVVFATGLALMPRYVPSVGGAWASVHHLESTPGGSTLRGLHYWATHALIVAFAVHLGRLMLAAAFRSPRELAWVSGVLLMPLLVVAAVTGNPLSGSEKAFEQIGVEAAILGSAPVLGPFLKRMLVGGPEAGNLTLTHLYAFARRLPAAGRGGRGGLSPLSTAVVGHRAARRPGRGGRPGHHFAALPGGPRRPHPPPPPTRRTPRTSRIS